MTGKGFNRRRIKQNKNGKIGMKGKEIRVQRLKRGRIAKRQHLIKKNGSIQNNE
jgi:hypothetical protein